MRAAGGEVERNASASLLDIGDGVFCLEFHCQDERDRSRHRHHDDEGGRPRRARRRRRWSSATTARRVLRGRQPVRAPDGARPGKHEATSTRWSSASRTPAMRTRYARVPVVAAPFGLTLGGGAEVVMGCQVVRAAAELYVGCVEVGVGLIPAGGGCMEMAARAAARAHRRSAVRPPVADAGAVPEARARRACGQRRGGARHRASCGRGTASRWRARR